MAANKRIFYAIEQLDIAGDGAAFSANTAARGVQSCGITTNFNLTQVFQLGMISLYTQVEELPDVQVSLSKVMDGNFLLYHMATVNATDPTLVGRSASKCQVGLSIFPDTNTRATGGSASEVICSGQFVNSVSYKVEVGGNGTEDISLGGNNKVWANDPNMAIGQTSLTITGRFAGTEQPIAAGNQLVRRQSVQFATTGVAADANGSVIDSDCTVLPQEIPGITASGINPLGADGNYGAHVESISMSCDLNRTALNELGHLGPYTRYANFPVQVTCEIACTAISGDMISANEVGIYSSGTGCGSFRGNLRNRTIRLATCDGTRIYLGLKNKLSSVNYAGGDTGGGNVTVTYSYRTFNDFTVMHSGDPHASGSAWWAARGPYLNN